MARDQTAHTAISVIQLYSIGTDRNHEQKVRGAVHSHPRARACRHPASADLFDSVVGDCDEG
eukprot:6732596-Alexandrium_andersonii.AAC.1